MDERPEATTACPLTTTPAAEATGGRAGAPADATLGGVAGGAAGGAPGAEGAVGRAAAGTAAVGGGGAGGVASRVGVDGSGRVDILSLTPAAALPSARTRNSDGIHPESLFGSRTQNHVQP